MILIQNLEYLIAYLKVHLLKPTKTFRVQQILQIVALLIGALQVSLRVLRVVLQVAHIVVRQVVLLKNIHQVLPIETHQIIIQDQQVVLVVLIGTFLTILLKDIHQVLPIGVHQVIPIGAHQVVHQVILIVVLQAVLQVVPIVAHQVLPQDHPPEHLMEIDQIFAHIKKGVKFRF